MIEVDIHTKRIAADTRIYIARPGAKYRFFNQFVDNNFVGPDLPGLDFSAFDNVADIADLEERIKRSAAIRRYVFRGDRDLEAPTRELEDYKGLPSGPTMSQLARVVRAYFGAMKQGDLVVVPPANFKGMAHIGELTSLPTQTKTLGVGVYGDDLLTGRNVRWLASVEKLKLPAQTLDALQKPSPLFLLVREAWPAIFRRAYGSYVTDTEFGSRFEITSEKYKTTDDFYIQGFFNFVAANTEKVRLGQGQEMLSFKEGAFSAEGLAPDLYTNVNSPGGLSLKSTVITPIIIAVMLALAVDVGPEAFAAARDGNVTFGNSLAPANDPCSAEVQKQVVSQLTLLGYDRWSEACVFARAAAERTGISTTVDVKK
ncbi:hypothetical protein MOV66_04470 [Agrobacterium sp. SHOUNA12C]|nr:hypothetical protein [Agrobacterium sp. BETTINA12B]MCJ9755886.1 hypothetical protein [Agrobacterium sp. SHOUNA12C]